MSVFHRFDAWLIVAAYQPIVDLLQMAPTSLARQCIVGMLVIEVVRLGLFRAEFNGVSWVFAGLMLVSLACYWLITKSAAWFAAVGSLKHVRFALVVICVVRLMALSLGVTPPVALSSLSDFAFLSLHYFAACRPPKPRVPRSRLASAGGAA